MSASQSEETRSPNTSRGEPASNAPSEAPLHGGPAYSPAETLRRACAEYMLGHYDVVLRTLEAAAQELTAAAEQAGGDASGRIQASRSAASAWALLARAAVGSNQPNVSARAAGRALAVFGMLRENAATLSGEELSNYAITLYLAGELDEAAEIMRQAVAHGGATPEMYLYQAILEYRRDHLEEALTALKGAETVRGRTCNGRAWRRWPLC